MPQDSGIISTRSPYVWWSGPTRPVLCYRRQILKSSSPRVAPGVTQRSVRELRQGIDV